MDERLELLAEISIQSEPTKIAELYSKFLESAKQTIHDAVVAHLIHWRKDSSLLVKSRPMEIRVAKTCLEWFPKVQVLDALIQSNNIDFAPAARNLVFRPLACAVTQRLLSEDVFPLPDTSPNASATPKSERPKNPVSHTIDESIVGQLISIVDEFVGGYFKKDHAKQEDLRQEVLYRILRRMRANPSEIIKLINYVRRTLRTSAADLQRNSEAPHLVFDSEFFVNSELAVTKSPNATENQAFRPEQLQQLIEQLSEFDRQLIVTRLVDGLPTREIAQKLFYLGFEVQPRNLSQRLLDIEKRLRRMAKDQGGNLDGPSN